MNLIYLGPILLFVVMTSVAIVESVRKRKKNLVK